MININENPIYGQCPFCYNSLTANHECPERKEYSERAIREAPERLKRIEKFQKKMDEQQKVSWKLLMMEFTI